MPLRKNPNFSWRWFLSAAGGLSILFFAFILSINSCQEHEIAERRDLTDALKTTVAKIKPAIKGNDPGPEKRFALQRPYVIYFLPSSTADVSPGPCVVYSSDGDLERDHARTLILVETDKLDEGKATYVSQDLFQSQTVDHQVQYRFRLWAVDIGRSDVGATGEIVDHPIDFPDRIMVGGEGYAPSKEDGRPGDSTLMATQVIDHLVDLERWADSVTGPRGK